MSAEEIPLEARKSLAYKDAASYTGYSITSIRRAVAEGHLIASAPAGQRKPVILRESLDQWIDAGKNQ